MSSAKKPTAAELAAAAFSGTTQSCQACGDKVYPTEQLTADGIIYHRTCFKCSHCSISLKVGNYSSIDGVLYCKAHYDQAVLKTSTAAEGAAKPSKPDQKGQPGKSKVTGAFSGTQESCVACNKTVYPLEKVILDGNPYHKTCFRCTYGGCVISPSNHITHEGKLYCKHHFGQLFLTAGNYSKLGESDAETNTEKPPPPSGDDTPEKAPTELEAAGEPVKTDEASAEVVVVEETSLGEALVEKLSLEEKEVKEEAFHDGAKPSQDEPAGGEKAVAAEEPSPEEKASAAE